MSKPRIIIADTDVNYIIPLQLKFVEELFDKVDLEIITDKACFDEMFVTPQSAEILIVSEELYNSSMQRHNIDNIFLMVEQNENEETVDLNVNLIFKYTSIKEIFYEITTKSAVALSADADVKQKTKVVLTYSAGGGAGKTTVSMGISACLTKNYKRVLYIDAEYLQSFQRILENKTPISGSDIYAKLSNPSDRIYDEIKHIIRKEKFSYLPPFKAAIISLGLNYSVYKKIILSAKNSGDFDYIVVDTDSTFDENKAELFDIADKIIVLTEQTEASAYATNVFVSNVVGINSDKYTFVCNKFNKDKDNALISPSISIKFAVSEYIEWNERLNKTKISEAEKDSGIQKTAFLIL